MDRNSDSLRNFKIDDELASGFLGRASSNRNNSRKNKDLASKESNTLDYYNDELSIKAVGKLMDNVEKDDFVKGFNEDREDPRAHGYAEERHQEKRPMQKRPAMEEPDVGYERPPQKRAALAATDDAVRSKVVSAMNQSDSDKPYEKRGRNIEEYTDSVNASSDTEESYDYSMFRRNQQHSDRVPRPLPSQKITNEQREAPQREPVGRQTPVYGQSQPPTSGPRDSRRPRQKNQFLTDTGSFVDINEDTKKDVSDKGKGDGVMRGTYKTPGKGRQSSKRFASLDDTQTEFSDSKRDTIIRASAFVIILAFFVILALLFMKMNSTSKDLETANSKIEEYKKQIDELNDLKIKNSEYTTKIKELTDLVTELKASNTEPVPEASPGAPQAPSGAGTSSTGQRTYTVQTGDNLSKISKQFYGSIAQSAYQKIIDANNLKDAASIKVGQVLIIP